MELSELKTQLYTNGYCRIEGFLDRETLSSLATKSSEVLSALTAAHRERFKSNGSLCNFADHPEFSEIVAYPKASQLLNNLFESDPKWIAGYLISKPPKAPPLFWHQDWWGWESDISYQTAPTQLFFMYYLVDTSVQNGCLRVIPGSHRCAHALHNVSAAHSKELAKFKDSNDVAFKSHKDEVAIEVKAGDLIVGDARLLHSAYSNQSSEDRPLLTLWYTANYDKLPETIQARYQSIFLREELDVEDESNDNPATVMDWPESDLKRVSNLLPNYQGNASPLEWNRIPDTSKLL